MCLENDTADDKKESEDEETKSPSPSSPDVKPPTEAEVELYKDTGGYCGA